MRVLWITFNYFPDICKEANLKESVTGSWVFAYAKAVMQLNPEIKLGVATPYKGKVFRNVEINGINYYLIPSKNNKLYNPKLEPIWLKVKEHFEPQIIHIHGSEYPLGLSYVRACGPKGVVLSIQGLVSVIERHYMGGITNIDVFKNITFRDIVRFDSLFGQKRDLLRRGTFEKELIQKISHVIGRTDWDRAHSWAINPGIKYHFCNETLRDSFYNKKWKYNDCEKYSIFLSQSQYPLKGLHKLIRALPIIIREFPQTKVYIAGSDILNNRGIKISGYGWYIKKILNKNKNHVVYLGQLSELKIIERLLKTNIFVCPSSIENSSLSTCEAQILGVPTIAAYVGGIPSLITHEKTGLLYRFEEPELLAWEICKVFSDPQLRNLISENGIIAAKERHDPVKNAKALNNAYSEILMSL